MRNILNKISSFYKTFKHISEVDTYKRRYRIIEIINEDDIFTVHIQLINSRKTFLMKPEEILADDDFVIYFSPLDVRTLTYLGYLGINSPKYKILAQRIAEQGNLIFVIKQKGSDNVILKTSKEVINDINFLKNMSSNDISSIAYSELQEK
jgi:hypothetical protein